MWVLSTARAELYCFTNCAAIPRGYAILSHTWDTKGEQSLQDVQNIIEECKSKGENPRDHVNEKIRRCCEIAEGDGYHWVWIDSCCIDKTSSTELSEAINSMFNWYALAEVCYVYLEDVPHGDNPHAKKSKFRTARWHSRGWTLQELLAPAFIIFFSREWEKIGTKYDLRRPLSRCTGIDAKYLTRKWDFRVHASVATRMSWAAKRKTTRVEDEAYCLLGLFDINMPTLYGEGQHAFQRLQVELTKKSTDATLFVWGPLFYSRDDQWEQPVISNAQGLRPSEPYIYLFAPSPNAFIGQSKTRYFPSTLSPTTGLLSPPNFQLDEKDNAHSRAHDEVPSFKVTPYGMKCRFPVATVDGVTVAILPCRFNGKQLGLLLHPASSEKARGTFRHLYCVSWSFLLRKNGPGFLTRLSCLGSNIHNLQFRGKPVIPTWQDIYIAAHPPTTGRTDGAHLLQHFLPDVAPTFFRIPRTLVQMLSALKFFPLTVSSSTALTKGYVTLLLCNPQFLESVHILVGTCAVKAAQNRRPRHWAWAEPLHREIWNRQNTSYVHNCNTDHIEDWNNNTRYFGDPVKRTIRLVFAPCPYTPEETLVLGLELAGSVYERIQKNANISLPPPTRFPHAGHVKASAGRRGPAIINSQNSTPAFSSSSSSSSSYHYPGPSSVSMIPAAVTLVPGTDRPRTAPHSPKTSSEVNSITQELPNMSMVNAHPAGRNDTAKVTVPEANVTNDVGDIITTLRREFQETLKAHKAARDRELHEMKESHDAHTNKLMRIIEATRDEVAQLKALPNV